MGNTVCGRNGARTLPIILACIITLVTVLICLPALSQAVAETTEQDVIEYPKANEQYIGVWRSEGIRGYQFIEEMHLWPPVEANHEYYHPSTVYSTSIIPAYTGIGVAFVIPFTTKLTNSTIGFGIAPFSYAIGAVKTSDFAGIGLPDNNSYIFSVPFLNLSVDEYLNRGELSVQTCLFSYFGVNTLKPFAVSITEGSGTRGIGEGRSISSYGYFLVVEPRKTPDRPKGLTHYDYWSKGGPKYALCAGLSWAFGFGDSKTSWMRDHAQVIGFISKNEDGEICLLLPPNGYLQRPAQ